MVQIIGAGPVGNFAAYLLERAGYATTVHEEHRVIGKPIQCTGILTAYISDLLSLNLQKISQESLVNTITGTRVFAPDGKSVYFRLKKNYIVDRCLFDTALGELAMSAGTRYGFGSRFVRGERTEKGLRLHFHDGTSVEDGIVVGADGPGSLVARSFGLFGRRSFVVGVQARMRMKKKIDSEVIDFYVDHAEPGYIGWVVPEDERVARVGVASYWHTKELFDALVKKRSGKVLEWQSGQIPMYDPKLRTADRGVYLVGDAATMVKATTYGGILPGMHAASCLPAALEGKDYERLWKKKIGLNLWLHLRLRRLMNNFTVEDYNRLVEYSAHPGVKRLLERYDREYPSKLVIGILLREPRFLSFASKFIFSNL